MLAHMVLVDLETIFATRTIVLVARVKAGISGFSTPIASWSWRIPAWQESVVRNDSRIEGEHTHFGCDISVLECRR